MPSRPLSNMEGPSGPSYVIAYSGAVTIAQVLAEVRYSRSKQYSFFLNGASLLTASLSVNFEIWDAGTAAYIANPQLNFYGSVVSPPFVVSVGASVFFAFYGPCDRFRLNVPTFGTSTGSIAATIWAL